MAATAKARAKATISQDGIVDALGESRVGATAVSKAISNNLTLEAPPELNRSNDDRDCGSQGFNSGSAEFQCWEDFCMEKTEYARNSSDKGGIHALAAPEDNTNEESEDEELVELNGDDNNEDNGNDDEGDRSDEQDVGEGRGDGGGCCECMVCNGNDNSRRGRDGRDDGLATSNGEMAQCALHSIFYLPTLPAAATAKTTTTSPAWTWTSRKTKSSCFMILCKTCAKRIFHHSPSPPSSSSLCVHGRHRGRRNSTSTSSIRKEDVVSEATQVSVDKDPTVACEDFSQSRFPDTCASSGGSRCVGPSAKSANESLLCLDALRKVLAEHDGDLVLVQNENSSEVQSIVEAINRVLISRKSLFNRVQASSVRRRQYAKAKNAVVKGAKSSVRNWRLRAKNAENQSSSVKSSAADGQFIKRVKGQLNNRVDDEQCVKKSSIDGAVAGIELRDIPDNSSSVFGNFSGPICRESKGKYPLYIERNTSFGADTAQLSDGGYKPQPTPIQKNSTQEGDVDANLDRKGNEESSFVASYRLKRLEEHFKGFVFTKKLLKDEPLVSVTDSDCSNNSPSHCYSHELEICKSPSIEAFSKLPTSANPSFNQPKNGSTLPYTEASFSCSQLWQDYSPHTEGSSSSAVDLYKPPSCEDSSSTRLENEIIVAKCSPPSKHDSCLQVPGKRQTSTSIHSSLSTLTGPLSYVTPTESDSQIDQKYVDNKESVQQVHLNVIIEDTTKNEGATKEQCKNFKFISNTQEHQNPNQKCIQTPLEGPCEQIEKSAQLHSLQQKKAVSFQCEGTNILQFVSKTAECQSHIESSQCRQEREYKSNNGKEVRNGGKNIKSSEKSSDKSQQSTPKESPPPLPPRLPLNTRQSVLAGNLNVPLNHLCEDNNNRRDCPLSVISLHKNSVGASSNGKNSFITNNNISYSECEWAQRNSVSHFHSPPLESQTLPRSDGGEVSCCEFDVRFVHDFKDFNLTLECYDEFQVENCCENNYCYIGNDSLSSASPSPLSGSSSSTPCGLAAPLCSVIEAVPLFQYQHHQSYPFEPTHCDLHHYIHHCHVVPASSSSTMRELNGPLRGLLKKPNRPPPARKNRVVFDETRNEFFEADYIILIREDCAYDEEDEEPCTCGEHELVRLCCEEGCQCNYGEDNVTPQSPKYAPPIEFVDEAALSPPDGYKDNGLNALSGALSGHVFGAQHIQQLQVIQRLQQQRAAMLAARASNQQGQSNQQNQQQQQQQPQQQQQLQQQNVSSPSDEGPMPVCSECVECVECAAKQLQDEECVALQCQEDLTQLSVPHVALLPLHNNSPERRITQKEIVAGEERPKYVATTQHKETEDEGMDKILSAHKNQRYVVETITMTTVTERRIVTESTEDVTTIKSVGTSPAAVSQSQPVELPSTDRKPPIPAKPESIPAQISGILKGGKLWKNEMQSEESNNPTSDDDSNSKRSVRFITEGAKDGTKEGCEGQGEKGDAEPINELIPLKKHSTLFHNVLRPNSAVRQLFPAGIHSGAPATTLTHEALKAFEDSKRGGLVSNLLTVGAGDTDTIRRTIERNTLRRSLIKKKAMKMDMTLEERIKQLTCDIDEPSDSAADDESAVNVNPYSGEELERRDSPAGEENPTQAKYIPDKSFSPSSSASSSSSGSTSAYRKISDIFNRDRRQEKIPEAEENPIVIIPQECRCPAAPDLGMGVQVPAAHTQIHQTPPRQTEPRRQFLSTLAPLTACVAGQKDDFSYYTLAAGDRNANASAQCLDYNLSDIESALSKDESRKVAPDVIAGTPGQEQDELVIFAQQEANRTDKIKKRYNNEHQHQHQQPISNQSSDDDEQNDYGFNKRPTVQGVKAKYEATNEIIEEMQAQLSQNLAPQQPNPGKTFNTLKQTNSIGSTTGKSQPQVQQNNVIPQNPADRPTWSYYSEEQRAELLQQQQNYYQALPANFKQAFQTHEEALMYQNCQSVSMRQHYGRFARSPSRRPESPPPLRNYHQTMVLIPYNTQSYAQFSTTNDQQTSAHQFRRQNVLEYQQVTQQTIRVPIGYTLPGMQLHLVAGRGTHQQHQHVQYSQNPRLVAPRTFNIPQPAHDTTNIKFAERGVPEGSASTTHTDCKGVMSPTSAPASQNQCNQTSQVSSAVPGAVFYAMNV